MSVYKITRPQGSERNCAYAISLKLGESVYVNHKTAAAAFNSLGWKAEEVHRVPKGENLIIAETHHYLKRLLEPEELHEMEKEVGHWLVTPDKENQRICAFGRRCVEPFETLDADEAAKFKSIGFIVEPFKKEDHSGESNIQIEGEDEKAGE